MINQYRVFQIKEVHHQHWAKSYAQQVENGFLIHHQNYNNNRTENKKHETVNVASYMLKGYAMEKNEIAEKYRATSFKTLKRRISLLSDILDNAYGKSYCQISNPTLVNNEVDTDMFLTEYIILAIHLNSQGVLSDVVLNKVKENADLMI